MVAMGIMQWNGDKENLSPFVFYILPNFLPTINYRHLQAYAHNWQISGPDCSIRVIACPESDLY
jgi:hypothetical protein